MENGSPVAVLRRIHAPNLKGLAVKHLSLILISALCLAGAAQAQKAAPGLWETTITMKMQGAAGSEANAAMAQMQQHLAAMPPEKRAQMEAMMAQRSGSGGAGMAMGMGMMSGKPTTTKVCITPELANNDGFTQSAQRDGCKQLSKERSGNTVKFKFACTGEHASTGEGEFTFINEKTHTGRVTMESMVAGKPSKMEMAHTGRWLGSDCGDVKPLVEPAAPAKK